MSAVEIIALILCIIALVELIIWLINPEILLSFAEAIYARSGLTQIVYLIVGAVLLFLLFGRFSMVEIMAVFAFTACVMGLALAPYGTRLVDLTRELFDEGRFGKQFAPVWIAWIVLVLWTLYELFV